MLKKQKSKIIKTNRVNEGNLKRKSNQEASRGKKLARKRQRLKGKKVNLNSMKAPYSRTLLFKEAILKKKNSLLGIWSLNPQWISLQK